jgi:alpha-amylase
MKRTIWIINLLVAITLSLAACKPAVHEYNGLMAPGDAGWWNQAVFYEIFVRSFQDSDGDGNGDLAGVLEKLDYLNDGDPETHTDLGITALWLMPVFTSDSYHGYDVKNYYNIDPDYGTLGDFKALVEAAHERGMRVILDLVINHTSSQHPWFVASQDPSSPYRDWYRWSDDDPGGYYEGGRTVWHALNNDYYYGYFSSGMPDLNYKNEEVTSKMLNIARFWAIDMDVDGFRIDAARYLIEDGEIISNTPETHAWFNDFYTKLRAIKPDIYLVGEVWADSQEAAAYVQGHELTATFDFDLSTALINSINSRNASSLNTVLATDYPLFDHGSMGVFLTNHDMPRSMSQFGDDASKARLAAFLLLTAPGTPYIYYGEEIGMLGQKPDERIRTPMQWSGEATCGFGIALPPSGEVRTWEEPNNDCNSVNITAEQSDPGSLWNTYAALIHLRQSMPALSNGAYFPLQSNNPAIYSALRVSHDQALLLVANLGLKDITQVGLVLESGPLIGGYSMTAIYGEAQDSQVIANAQGGFTLFDSIREIGAMQAVIYLLEPR